METKTKATPTVKKTVFTISSGTYEIKDEEQFYQSIGVSTINKLLEAGIIVPFNI